MSFFSRFYPDFRAASVYTFPYAEFYEKGYRGLIFDIDNTLVFHNAPATEKAKALFGKLHAMGFSTILLSNNNEGRVKPFAKALDSGYVYSALKPKRKGYWKAMELMETTPRNTILFGDQIFTDVWGGRRCGITTVLVDSLKGAEEIQIIFKRNLEKLVLDSYEKHRTKAKFT